ncbi:MAG: YciK family oxidoreductase [Candidatus Muproteobacteria bacterium RIFCSPHIGHO2_12_FULL_60_33]|uniref:YciK family oxidoreductase n=1 Tax=Candidatus Muproteobacteria bacterium RIFCSPLOWO2_01_FULL_60_18 TaxID=1817768 RepID=A0A1F6TZ42_9PROT|nr:MAG: YciK family oxidoreductase [Candidatus Muproteobacteria bacterium RIFCSPLOWO2_01_FULL_60_18]OGI53329.1 MAG: YciK family oxidoreductase [Candidatus Muproteobacteria bacterium RIFCSPHIGHO2_01_60_12]OGI54471.1 MAG: YciK family oxidoreductase [Candidatus Muproteobacteria bacterium RIFCSPHIGHO2_12_FULL_60_33]OGI55751.1 MAG: YciK family oxidoreductase [Candidatus Muproteobacteria bacterium RIFCSPHIGHO2_02_FULL_60_13]
MPPYMPAPHLLASRHILVTGAGDGIGRAAALALAEHGASVILLGRTASKLEKVYDEIERRGWPQPALLPLDLAQAAPAHYEQVAHTVEKEFGHLDGLLHNAADAGTLTPIELYDPETWYRVMQLNLNAAWLLTRACLPLLRKSADASIVFTTADVGREGRAYWGAYGVSCFGLEGLMQILAAEVASEGRLRANSLNPGAVRTAMRSRLYPGEDVEKLPRPEDIMPAYLYLLGPDSRGVNGQALNAHDFLAHHFSC